MLPLALTMGDPAGIGGELTLAPGWRCGTAAAVLRRAGRSRPAGGAGAALGADGADARTSHASASRRGPFRRGVAGAAGARSPRRRDPGQPDPANAPAVIASIERADRAGAGAATAGGVVTNPINKAALYEAGFAYPGHTEFLAALTGARGARQVMMLAARTCASCR